MFDLLYCCNHYRFKPNCKSKAMSEILARTYFHQLISGIEAFHNTDSIHGDLTPDRLMLNENYC